MGIKLGVLSPKSLRQGRGRSRKQGNALGRDTDEGANSPGGRGETQRSMKGSNCSVYITKLDTDEETGGPTKKPRQSTKLRGSL